MSSEKTPQAHRDSTNTPPLELHGIPKTLFQKFKVTMMVPLITFIVLALLGQVLEVSTNQYIQLQLLYLCANIIFAVSLNLVNGFTGQFSIGHAGFMAVGAYTSAMLAVTVHDATGADPNILWFIGFALAGGVAAAIAGLIVGVPSLRLRGDYLAIVTLGFGEIIRVILLNMSSVGGARGLPGIPRPHEVDLGNTVFTPFYFNYVLSIFWVIVTVTFMWRLVNSVQGRAFLSVREDEVAAQSMGINTTRVKVRAFVIAAFFAGISGSVFAHSVQFISPSVFGFTKSIDAIIMVVLGGMGSITGSIFAAFVVTLVPEFVLRPLTDITGVDLRMVIYSLTLILFMILRPKGILGTREITDFWRRNDGRSRS